MVDEIAPELVDGIWTQRLVVRSLTQQELDNKAESARLRQEMLDQMQQQTDQVNNTEEPSLNVSVTQI
jgi:hypothetical protein